MKKNSVEWSVEIHQLDVGQGDSALILFKKGDLINKSILLDGGYGYNKRTTREYVRDKIEVNNRLTAVIQTHNDADHINGLPTNQDIDVVNANTRLFSYNNFQVGQTIWAVLNENKPVGAPDMLCVASNGWIMTQNQYRFVSNNDENNKSLGFVIQHGNFRFFTAGDLESSHEDVIYFDKSLSVFKAGHHGSKESSSSRFLNKVKSRATIISHGNRKFSTSKDHHPNNETLQRINNSTIMFAYLTNPCNKQGTTEDNCINQREKQRIIQQNKKYVIAGHSNTLLEDGVYKNPKGHIVVKSCETQANKGKFTIEQQNQHCKTSDYYKDSRFSVRKNTIANTVASLPVETLNNDDQKTELLLTKEQLRFFGNGTKIEHLTHKALQKAVDDSYSQKQMTKKFRQGKLPIYRLSILNKSNEVALEIKKSPLGTIDCDTKKEYHQDHDDGLVSRTIVSMR